MSIAILSLSNYVYLEVDVTGIIKFRSLPLRHDVEPFDNMILWNDKEIMKCHFRLFSYLRETYRQNLYENWITLCEYFM